MNALLVKNRPKDCTVEEFKKMWENAAYTLQALYNTLEQMQQENASIRKDDFDCPNHYAKLAYQSGKIEAYKEVLNMLPKGCE